MNLEDLEQNHQPNKKPVQKRETNQMKQVRPDDIAPREKEDPGNTFGVKLMEELDSAIRRDQEEMYENVVKPAKEYLEAKEMFGEKGEDAYFERELGETVPVLEKRIASVSFLNGGSKDVSSDVESLIENTSLTGLEDVIYDDDQEEEEVEKEEVVTAPLEMRKYTAENPTGVVMKEDITDVLQKSEDKQQKEVDKEDILKSKQGMIITEFGYGERESFKKELEEMFEDDKEVEDLSDLDDEERATILAKSGYIHLTDETKEEFRHEVMKTAAPFSNVVNLSEYTVSKKPLSTSQMLKSISVKKKMANWVFQNADRAFTMSELTGAEIEKVVLNDGSFKDKEINKQVLTACRVFYDHIIDSNKPNTFEGWLKTIYWEDFLDLYFGAYRACFTDSNYIPYTCPDCKHTFMEHHELSDMVKFESDEVKNHIASLIAGDTTSSGNVEGAIMLQIADNIIISINKMSIYTSVIELPILPQKLLENFEDLTYMIAYIQDIYIVNHETKELRIVDTKPEPNNIQKTVKNKYRVFFDIINSLSSDQYDYFMSVVNEFVNNTAKNVENSTQKIKYYKPASKCPKCGKPIPEIQASQSFLLFIRHRLQTI